MDLFKKLFGQKDKAFDEERALEQEAVNGDRLSYQRVYRVLANAYRYKIEGVRSARSEDGLFAEEEYEYETGEILLYVRYEPSRYAEKKSIIHVRIIVREVGGAYVVCDDMVEEPMALAENNFVQWKQNGKWCEQTDDLIRQLGQATYEAHKAKIPQS